MCTVHCSKTPSLIVFSQWLCTSWHTRIVSIFPRSCVFTWNLNAYLTGWQGFLSSIKPIPITAQSSLPDSTLMNASVRIPHTLLFLEFHTAVKACCTSGFITFFTDRANCITVWLYFKFNFSVYKRIIPVCNAGQICVLQYDDYY